jgi:hypothetical protein
MNSISFSFSKLGLAHKINNLIYREFSNSAKARIKTDICYYKLLNLTPNSNFEEIKKEYYKLAKKYHPDNKENSSANQTVIIKLDLSI